jgi:two-component system nitrate/nitrite response regulator NarP
VLHRPTKIVEPKSVDQKSLDRRPAPSTETTATMTIKARVLIADKSPVVRAGLADYIGRDARFEVLGAVATGAEFASQAELKRAEIGVVGWALPDITGGALLAMLKRRHIGTRVVVYTGDGGKDVLRESVREGAWGFISKAEEPEVLIEALAAVARGRLSLPYIDMRTLNADPIEALTGREKELLAALANGWTNLQIAARTGISSNTVKYHLKNLYDKLGVNNRAMAVALFVARERDQR